MCRLIIIAAVFIAARLKLSSELTLPLLRSLNLSTLGGKTGLLFGRVFLCRLTTLLLLGPLQLTSLDLLLKSTERRFLLLALLLELALLTCFLVPTDLLATVKYSEM